METINVIMHATLITGMSGNKQPAPSPSGPAKRDMSRRLIGADGQPIINDIGDDESETDTLLDRRGIVGNSNSNSGGKDKRLKIATEEDIDNEGNSDDLVAALASSSSSSASGGGQRPSSGRLRNNNSNSINNNDDDNDDSDDYIEQFGTAKRRGRKGTAKAKNSSSSGNSDEDDDDEEGDVDSGPDESGNLNLPGHILKVQCSQFMCHNKFSLKFGKNINFITGPNGSGKSAVVAAIMICLGARASTTGRGSTLASYVREGSPGPAVVEVTLKNQGEDAYMPHLYGKTITVRRKIMKAGSVSAYQLLNEKMQVVSEKKHDLEQILRAFNIDVQNPCCMLTQEDSKKFIRGSEADKYDFFLRATGLKRAHEEYHETKDILDQTRANQNVIEDSMNMKEALWNKTKDDLDKFLATEHLEDEKRQLQAKKYWVEVEAKDALVAKETGSKAKLEKEIKAYEEKYAEALSHLHESETDDSVVINEIERITHEIEEVKSKENSTNKEYNELNKALSQRRSKLQETLKTIQDSEKTLAANVKEVTDLHSRQKRDDSARERALEEKKNEIMGQIADLREKESSVEAQKSAADLEVAEMQKRFNDARNQVEGIKRDLDRCNQDLKGMSSAGKGSDNRVNALSREAVACYNAVKREIQNGRLFRGEVIGPLLLHIAKLKNVPQEMSQAIEKSIGGNFDTYIVTCKEDERALRNLTKAIYNRFSIIVQSPHQGGSGGGVSGMKYNVNTEKIPNVTRLIDVLSIEHPLVYNTLLDMAEIDRVAIVKDESHMKSTLVQGDGRNRNFKHGIKAAFSYNGTQFKYAVGNQSAYPNYDRSFNPKLVSDMADIIKAKEREIADKTTEYGAAAKEAGDLDKSLRDLKQRREGLNSALSGGGARSKESRTQLHNQAKSIEIQLQELRAVSSIDTSDLEKEIQALRNTIADLNAGLGPLQESLQSAEEKLEACKEAKKEVSNRKQKLQKELDAKSDTISRNNMERDKLLDQVELAKRVLGQIKQKLESQAKTLQMIEADRDERLAFAKTQTADLIEQWDGHPLQLASSDTTASLDNQIRRLNEKIIKHRQENALLFTGISLEMLTERCNNAKRDYRDCKKQKEDNLKSVDDLEQDIKDRAKKWKKQRSQCEKTVTKKFNDYLQMKGQAGKIDFDHEKGTLSISVLVDNTKKKSDICTDVQQLSGGERSYATLCLLLAFDHVIDFPFRLMDEYDVFMDEFTRKITLTSIVEHALTPSQRNKQIFIITPLNLKGLNDLKGCQKEKILINQCRKPDPSSARGLQQQTLNFLPVYDR